MIAGTQNIPHTHCGPTYHSLRGQKGFLARGSFNLRGRDQAHIFCSLSQASSSGLSIARLKESIQQAIDEEDYEAAASFRDELKEKEEDAHSAVEEANRMFYVAFEQADLKMMARVWGKGSHVQCIHPLLPCIPGDKDVLEGWRMILQGNKMVKNLKIVIQDLRIHVNEDQAFVTCIERMEGEGSSGRTAATNVFERQDGEWKIVHHHGGPVGA